MDGNVTQDGIRKDIEWMERVGIGGFHQFDAGGIGMKPIVSEPMPYGSPGWKVAFRYAMELANAKGMETAVASAPGWSSTPSMAALKASVRRATPSWSISEARWTPKKPRRQMTSPRLRTTAKSMI